MDNPQGLVHAAADLCGWSARISGKVPLLLPQVGRRYFVIYIYIIYYIYIILYIYVYYSYGL